MWNPFANIIQKEEAKDLKVQVESLVTEKRSLKEELEDLKLKKRLEQEEITHMVKINEEKLKAELVKEKLSMERENQKEINRIEEESMKKIQDSLIGFHEKMENKFDSELKNMKDVLALLMKGLPNVNMEITKHIGPPAPVKPEEK